MCLAFVGIYQKLQLSKVYFSRLTQKQRTCRRIRGKCVTTTQAHFFSENHPLWPIQIIVLVWNFTVTLVSTFQETIWRQSTLQIQITSNDNFTKQHINYHLLLVPVTDLGILQKSSNSVSNRHVPLVSFRRYLLSEVSIGFQSSWSVSSTAAVPSCG